jgi:prephenate dehydrogenase
VSTSEGERGAANVIGLGLIGGSVAFALTSRGWRVHGEDHDAGRMAAARAKGAIAAEGLDPAADITFVATPVAVLADTVKHALAATAGLVTDVGSVKANVAEAIGDPRFCGGHPMAGSELDGLDGADGDMFVGAVWVLTPTAGTADDTFAGVARIVADLGAEVVALPPDRHDALVAVVSHVPHLAAAALMTVADQRAEEHAALLRLAAGGFRDMTRIAAGDPAIWLDICAENRPAIVEALDALVARLGSLRQSVAEDDRDELLAELSRAREARVNLPGRVARSAEMVEVRTAIPDRPGAAAGVFTLAAELGVNVTDFEVFHSAEGERGVLVLVVDAAQSELFRGGLIARGYRPSVHRLG